MMYQKPDRDEYYYLHSRGEFSIQCEESFGKHLQNLLRKIPERLWYGGVTVK